MESNRLFRVTWNTERWETPSRHKWSYDNQGNSNIAYENQYGYGFEEWLFNPRFQIDGYQYGYIRGVETLDANIEIVNKAILFSISPDKERYIVGEINNAHVILGWDTEQYLAKKLYLEFFEEMKEELREVEADYKDFNKDKVAPNVKFKISDAEIYQTPIEAPELKGRRWNRFNPYIIEGDLKNALDKKLPTKDFVFNPGVASSKDQITKSVKGSKGEYTKIHNLILRDVCKHLAEEYSADRKNLSVEKTRFGTNIADIVLAKKDNEHIIIEAKTSGNARKNIREALGQLIDYSFWYENVTIDELIIVAPITLNELEIAYLNRVKKAFSIKLSYWYWDAKARKTNERIKVVA